MMKLPMLGLVLTCLVVLVGCDSKASNESAAKASSDSVSTVDVAQVNAAIVDAGCGQCMLGEPGNGCDLAIRFEGAVYFVDGTSIDDHGDAHSDDGLCNAIRKARITGRIADGRFMSESFELLNSEVSGNDQ